MPNEPAATADDENDLLADVAAAPSTDPLGDAEKIATLDNKKAELEAELAVIKTQRAEVEARLLVYAEEHQLQNITIGGRVVYLRAETWAFRNPTVDEDTYLDALRADPSWAYLVVERTNAQKVSARYREALGNGDLPEAIAAVITEDRRYSIVTRVARR